MIFNIILTIKITKNMKKFIILFKFFICAILFSHAQTHFTVCQYSTTTWDLQSYWNIQNSTDTVVYFTTNLDTFAYNHYRNYDTIIGNILTVTIDTPTICRLVSINGQLPTFPLPSR